MPKIGGEHQNRSLRAEVGVGLHLIKLKIAAFVFIGSTQLNSDGYFPVEGGLPIPLNIMMPIVVGILFSGIFRNLHLGSTVDSDEILVT